MPFTTGALTSRASREGRLVSVPMCRFWWVMLLTEPWRRLWIF